MAKLDLHYTDPRLVALYDTDNPRGIDTDFFIQLANELQAQTNSYRSRLWHRLANAQAAPQSEANIYRGSLAAYGNIVCLAPRTHAEINADL